MATITRGSTATGHLVWGVPTFMQPVDLNQKPTPPIPPMPVQPKATIASFETPVTLGTKARAVAKVTQGIAVRFHWQYLDHGSWVTQANNPASDLDHHFALPSVGSFPIRLQTFDASGQQTDQTGTLRTIVVQPVVTPEPPIPPMPPTPLPPGTAPVLHASGQIFRTASGAPWRYRGVSAFKLCRLFTDGQSIDPFLAAYTGFNTLRVWDYTPVKDWHEQAWESCSTEQWRAFLAYVGAKGWTVECTLLTDDDPSRIQKAQSLIFGLAGGQKPTNLLVEIANEPDTHKSINTAALKPTLDTSGFVYASGNYEDSSKAFGAYLCAHTQRDSEWPRRAHDLLEYYNGHGPNKPEDPAHKCPALGDEPAKLQDVNGDRVSDWRAYFGTAAILGAGATFHSETGKFGQVPTAQEQALAAAALEGLNAFPDDAPVGAYSRPSDQSLRTYVVGSYSVRIRPTSASHPINGFVRTGASDVLWRRS